MAVKDCSFTPEQALHELRTGNSRFVSGALLHPNMDKDRLRTCCTEQHPFACILACADSRVLVELIFDRGVGDLFVVRVAGNVFGDDEIGSVEYAIEQLAVPALVAMGHSDCGMVKAVYEQGVLTGHLRAISEKIIPAVEAVKRAGGNVQRQGEPVMSLVDQAARINVWNAVEDALCTSPAIRSRVQSGSCHVVGAFYWIETGEIEWLGTHPNQEEILRKFEASP